jgi:hypothetical protein
MRIYLTHCSAQKASYLKGTNIAVTPDRLYTDPGIQQFVERCKAANVSWGILSDRYGIYLSSDRQIWYEKHPDTVTKEEAAKIVDDFDTKLSSYSEILFYIRPDTFHPFYRDILKTVFLADRVQMFHDLIRLNASGNPSLDSSFALNWH